MIEKESAGVHLRPLLSRLEVLERISENVHRVHAMVRFSGMHVGVSFFSVIYSRNLAIPDCYVFLEETTKELYVKVFRYCNRNILREIKLFCFSADSDEGTL